MANGQASNKYLKKVILAGAWIFGVWTPVQTGYEYISKEAGFFGFKITFHLVFYACYIMGGMILRWGIVTIVLAVILWVVTGALKNDDSSNLMMAVELAVSGLISFALTIYISVTDPASRPPAISQVTSDSKGAIFYTLVGGSLLWYVYLQIFRSITSTVKQMQESGELKG